MLPELFAARLRTELRPKSVYLCVLGCRHASLYVCGAGSACVREFARFLSSTCDESDELPQPTTTIASEREKSAIETIESQYNNCSLDALSAAVARSPRSVAGPRDTHKKIADLNLTLAFYINPMSLS